MHTSSLHHRLGIVVAACAVIALAVALSETRALADELPLSTHQKKYIQLDAKGAPLLVVAPTAALQDVVEVFAIAVSGNDIYVGGTFNSIGGVVARNIARYNIINGRWFALGADLVADGNGVNNTVNAIAIVGNDVYVGGRFSRVYTKLNTSIGVRCVAKWNTASASWSALGDGSTPLGNGLGGDVSVIREKNGIVYFGGVFKTAYHTAASTVTVNNIAAWAPATNTWSSLGKGIGLANGDVMAIEFVGDNLYAGGQFPFVVRADNYTLHVDCIARWNLTSKNWFPLGVDSQGPGSNGVAGDVLTLATDGTNLYVGGKFIAAHNSASNKPPANHVARWNGTTWSTLNNSNSVNSNGVNDNVAELCYSNGFLYVGGDFVTVRNTNGTGTAARHLTRWDGAAWSMIGDGVNHTEDPPEVLAIGIAGGQLYVGGIFNQAYNNPTTPVSVTGFARWTGTVWTSVTAPKSLAVTSAASFVANEAAADGIFSAFGAGMAAGTQAANTLPLPTNLLNTTISVRDAAGTSRPAALFFVSSAQINFLMPAQTASGAATVTINAADGSTYQGNINVLPVAPGLFTFNANGQGVVAAVALRIRNGAALPAETIARFDTATNKWVTTQIDLGPATDRVFLVAFGTGIRGRTPAMAMSMTMGGTPATISYASAQGSFVGLDQINAEIPRSLIGRGEIDVAFSLNGKTANTVKVNIK
jgi:uncharacterized protein (TIGR03437 family)